MGISVKNRLKRIEKERKKLQPGRKLQRFLDRMIEIDPDFPVHKCIDVHATARELKKWKDS